MKVTVTIFKRNLCGPTIIIKVIEVVIFSEGCWFVVVDLELFQ